jgi:tRNA modification GTPase TrmE
MFYNEDTIAAISTPVGTGGIGIVRISGKDAFSIAEKVFEGKRPFKNIKSHSMSYGKIVDPDSREVIDEVLLSRMNAPNTYTKEDIIEINCHGGLVNLRLILELVIKFGARLSEPGEFTKRAFLNGRIDLSQAEAVIDVINASSDKGAKAAVVQLEGVLSEKIRNYRDKLIKLMAHIEVTVDYPEEDIEEITGEEVYVESKAILEDLLDLSKSFDRGRLIKEGVNLVISGRPNVGKSSLLNALAGKNKAIVSEIPGTTRDFVEEYINVRGVQVKITDTAGIRETRDEIEKIGVDRAKEAIKNADINIVIIDGSAGILPEDQEILETQNDRTLTVVNKTDKADDSILESIKHTLSNRKLLFVSAKTGNGLTELEKEISGLTEMEGINKSNEVLITNIRHKKLIDNAVDSIREACASYEAGMPLDCLSIDIKNSADYLGQIIGESVNDDIIKEIFARFCIGK